MLIILVVCLVIVSMLILCVKQNKESLLLFGLCFSLLLEMAGVMIFIAKKGGISTEVLYFLYFSREIQMKFQYCLITLGKMGYLIALGRSLFPFFLLKLAMHYSMTAVIRKNMWLTEVIAVFPALGLIVYYPAVYLKLTENGAWMQLLLDQISMVWMSAYILLALFLLLYELGSITMKFCRRQFIWIVISMVALSGIYYLYYRQDPGQVYQFYSSPFSWNKGVGYLQIHPSLFSYYTLVVISVICCVMGFYSLFRFTSSDFKEIQKETATRQKSDAAQIGVSMFVHSMKNQLLSNRVVYKRISQLYEEADLDQEKLKEYIELLDSFNEGMLERMEELYRSVKANGIYMTPVPVEEVFAETLKYFGEKYPEVEVDTAFEAETKILADKTHLCEALCNLLTNAQEAILEAGREKEGKICLLCHNERLYTVIEVKDNGIGMSKKQMKKIFDPFYSSKNANVNWGMGLHYVREIVKSHLGSLRIESIQGEGSSFYMVLPKYQKEHRRKIGIWNYAKRKRKSRQENQNIDCG